MKKLKKIILSLSIILISIGILSLGTTYAIFGGEAIEYSLYDKEPSIELKNAKSPMEKVNIETLNEKEQLLYKMLNSIDYYETIEATINYHSTFETEELTQVTKLSIDKAKEASFMINYRDGLENSRIIIQKNEHTTIFKNDCSYITDSSSNAFDFFEAPVDDNFIKNLHPNERLSPYTKRIGCSYLPNTVQPLQNNPLLLEELILKQEDWIIKEKITYLDRICLLIKANVTLYTHSIITHAEILVDEKTGLILNSEFYDSNHRLSDSTEVTELKINKPIPPNTFTVDLTGLKEIKK